VGHPVPLVAGVQQRPGRDAAAKILRADFTDDRDDYVMDLRSAYPVPGLKKLTRSFAFLRPGAGTLTITDEFGMEKPGMFESALTTYSAWKQTGPDTLVFEKGGERLTAGIQVTRGSVTIREEKIEEGGISFTRIGIRMNEPLAAGAMKITFSPAVPANGG